MPIHPQDATQRLEPERMREAPQDAMRSLVQDEGFHDDRPELRHSLREPRRDASAVEGQVGTAGAGSHTAVQYARCAPGEATSSTADPRCLLTCAGGESVPGGPARRVVAVAAARADPGT